MNPIPICVRARNRAVYLDCTLKSLLHTTLPSNIELIVIDDCSDDQDAVTQLTTDGYFRLKQPMVWPKTPDWLYYAGFIRDVHSLQGLKGRIEIVQPPQRIGDRGGIFWILDYMFKRFPLRNEVIVIEADTLFNSEWYTILLNAYAQCAVGEGPNGNMLGLLSCYDRKGVIVNKNSWTWRSVVPLDGGRWGCGNGIGGVFYLVTRALYDASLDRMRGTYNPLERSGDTWLQALCGEHKFNIAVTIPSLCQHIGVKSSTWPEKGWRHTNNFRQPFAFESVDKDTYAYSKEWNTLCV